MRNKKRSNYSWVLIPLFFLFFFFFPLTNSFAEEKANIISFGANTEGKTNQTEFIQKAINYKSEQGGGIVFFPKGTYLIDAVKSIVLKDNITLEFEAGTVLKAIPNNSESFQIIKIHDVTNVKILGKVKIQGERQEHLGTLGEWGMGISIKGSKNVEVENPVITDNWGDGIYIGSTSKQNFSENIKVFNVVLDNNRRQGISIISVKNLEITNAVITNTNGTMPQGGIAIEPNNVLESLQNIRIINLSTVNNLGSGLLIYPGKLNGTNPVSIYIDNTKKIKDGYAVIGIEKLRGEINVGGYDYLSDKRKESMRISGTNRYDTAIAISKEGWDTAETVVLAAGSDFPDALAGGPLAFKKNAPVLLTRTATLTTATKNEIERLEAKKVIILGSTGAVSSVVETELKKMGVVIERIGGKDRFETAALIAKQFASTQAVVANGQNFPDVLSVSAYAAKNGIPILLARTESIPEETATALSSKTKTYVIGSSEVIGDSVFKLLPGAVRYGGKDRYETNYQVNTKLRMGTGKAFIATGMNYPDGLTGSVLAAKHNSPILLVKGQSVPETTVQQLGDYQSYAIFGGTGAVGETVRKILVQE